MCVYLSTKNDDIIFYISFCSLFFHLTMGLAALAVLIHKELSFLLVAAQYFTAERYKFL